MKRYLALKLPFTLVTQPEPSEAFPIPLEALAGFKALDDKFHEDINAYTDKGLQNDLSMTQFSPSKLVQRDLLPGFAAFDREYYGIQEDGEENGNGIDGENSEDLFDEEGEAQGSVQPSNALLSLMADSDDEQCPGG